MPKIKSMRLKNFQKHKNLSIDFHPGVNVFHGTSDMGKSSLIRAIEALAYNTYTDSVFYNPCFEEDWVPERLEKAARSYEVEIDTDVTIAKIRKNQTVYKIDGKEYSAVGRGLPTIIHPHLHLEEENIQVQHKPYFLINRDYDGPSVVAAALNKISGMGDATRAIAMINSDIKQETARIKMLKDEKAVLKRNTESLMWTEDAVRRLAKIRKYQELMEKIYDFRDNLFQHVSIPDFVYDFQDLIKAERELSAKREKVGRLVKRFNDLKVQSKPVPDSGKLLSLLSELRRTARKKKTTDYLLSQYQSINSELRGIKDILKNSKCPICKSVIK